jgi:hypothetical protein|tara:strand:+ start:5234 stop:5794 length:561 start_codon:yes stop_codon:yes gene_type:complete
MFSISGKYAKNCDSLGGPNGAGKTTFARQLFGKRLPDEFEFPNADLAVNRVQKRVQRGGHSIPEETIRRRFVRSNLNFITNYRQIVDHWVLLDGASTPPSKIASWGRGSSIKIEQPGHAALIGFEGEADSVQEETTEYGSENRFYTENLDDVITSVGEFLLNQETFEELVSEEWIKSTSYTLGSSE